MVVKTVTFFMVAEGSDTRCEDNQPSPIDAFSGVSTLMLVVIFVERMHSGVSTDSRRATPQRFCHLYRFLTILSSPLVIYSRDILWP